MNIMDRETVLKHSKSIRLEHKLLSDFTEILADFCERKGHPEHLQALIQVLNIPMIGQKCIQLILEEYEKEYEIIKLINQDTNQLIDIW